MPRPPLLGYLQSAVADNTAHSSIDRLLLEDEINNQPQHSMSVQDEPLEMTPEDAIPIGKGAKIIGNIIGGKYVPDRILKKGISDNKLEDSFAEKIKELKKFIDDKGFMGYASSSEINKAKKKMKELRNSYDELRPVMKGRNFQEGGQAHRNLLMESLSQQPQHSIRTSPESLPFKMTPEDAVPIGTGIGLASKMIRGTDRFNEMLKRLSRISGQEKKKFEVLESARRKFGDKLDAGGADKAGKKYLTTLYLEKLLGK